MILAATAPWWFKGWLLDGVGVQRGPVLGQAQNVGTFPVEFPIGYTRHVNANGGVVTWDVPITSEGRIEQVFVDQLAAIGNDLDS